MDRVNLLVRAGTGGAGSAHHGQRAVQAPGRRRRRRRRARGATSSSPWTPSFSTCPRYRDRPHAPPPRTAARAGEPADRRGGRRPGARRPGRDGRQRRARGGRGPGRRRRLRRRRRAAAAEAAAAPRSSTARNRVPRAAEPGEEGEERRIELELRLVADAGLVGPAQRRQVDAARRADGRAAEDRRLSVHHAHAQPGGRRRRAPHGRRRRARASSTARTRDGDWAWSSCGTSPDAGSLVYRGGPDGGGPGRRPGHGPRGGRRVRRRAGRACPAWSSGRRPTWTHAERRRRRSDLVVSGVSGEGLDELGQRLQEVVSAAIAAEPERTADGGRSSRARPVHGPARGRRLPRQRPRHRALGGRDRHGGPERVGELQRRLVKAGVERRLVAEGARRGDEVTIGGTTFEFIPDQDVDPDEGGIGMATKRELTEADDRGWATFFATVESLTDEQLVEPGLLRGRGLVGEGPDRAHRVLDDRGREPVRADALRHVRPGHRRVGRDEQGSASRRTATCPLPIVRAECFAAHTRMSRSSTRCPSSTAKRRSGSRSRPTALRRAPAAPRRVGRRAPVPGGVVRGSRTIDRPGVDGPKRLGCHGWHVRPHPSRPPGDGRGGAVAVPSGRGGVRARPASPG